MMHTMDLFMNFIHSGTLAVRSLLTLAAWLGGRVCHLGDVGATAEEGLAGGEDVVDVRNGGLLELDGWPGMPPAVTLD